jgi:hypothetical protein
MERSRGKCCLTAALMGLGVLTGPAGARAQTPPAPQLAMTVPTFDFGKVAEGTVVKYDFPIANRGKAQLVVEQVIPSCGCTIGQAPTEAVEPGQQAAIHVEFSTAGFAGEVRKGVRVLTNDNSQPSAMLTLTGVVEPEVAATPPRLVFTDVIHGAKTAPAVQEVLVQAAPGMNVKIGKAKSFSRYVKVSQSEASDKSCKLKVELSPDVPVGDLRERVVVELSDSVLGRSAMNIPVFAAVRPGLRLSPDVILFGLVGDKPITRSAKLESLTGEPVRITGMKSRDPAFQASISTVEPGRTYTITVRVDPEKLKDSISSAIELWTDSKEHEKVVLNVRAVLPYKP